MGATSNISDGDIIFLSDILKLTLYIKSYCFCFPIYHTYSSISLKAIGDIWRRLIKGALKAISLWAIWLRDPPITIASGGMCAKTRQRNGNPGYPDQIDARPSYAKLRANNAK